MLLHGSCAALAGEAVLFLAPPGGGKSDLLLRLIERGWRLVADDQVKLRVEAARRWRRRPRRWPGCWSCAGSACSPGSIGRRRRCGWWRGSPRGTRCRACRNRKAGPPAAMTPAAVTLPLIRLDPWAASAPDRLAVALRVLGGRLRMASGAFAA
jgi:hypothetical protein